MKSLRQKLRQWHNAVAVRRLGLSQFEPTDEPGLILIQIDGLSRTQLERAMGRGRMPFLNQLVKTEEYKLHTMYSGLPSTTPAVQGELFYGVRCVVPAFSFRDPVTGLTVRMVESESAARAESEMAANHTGLLAAGSAYTNIYSGGSAESHFCAATMGWNGMLDRATPATWILLLLLNWFSILRTCALMFVELWIGIYDALVGHLAGHNLKSELGLIPSRVAVGVGLRELATIGASIDISRGVRIVQLNYLGYDEQAHRRGPSSRFAHWSLRGIDRAIGRLVQTARTSGRRDYQIWVYSDHGQEPVRFYESEFGRAIYEAVVEACGAARDGNASVTPARRTNGRTSRAQWLRSARRKPAERESTANADSDPQQRAIEVVAIGPIGHIYLAADIDSKGLDEIAVRLVNSAHVSMVLRSESADRAIAWTSRGRFLLPDEAAEVVGEDHPFLSELAQDLIRLCHHQAAGKLILCGWSKGNAKSTSFVDENGAHGGPGPLETEAFVLAPVSARVGVPQRRFLRPEDFRQAARAEMETVRT